MSLNGYYTTCFQEDSGRRRLQTDNTSSIATDDDDDNNESGVPGVVLDVGLIVNEEDVSDQSYNSAEETFMGILYSFNSSSFDDILLDLSANSFVKFELDY